MKTFLNKTKDKGFFKTFIPLDSVGGSFIVEKEVGGVKRKFLVGQASNLKTDKELERVGKDFLEKMKNTAMGLTVFSEHDHSIEKTLGYISDVGGDDVFMAETALEPEDENALVKSILMKLDHGTKLGYSIGGRVTKAAKVRDEELDKDVMELLDGEIYELSLTAMPATYDTWVDPIFKSMKEITVDGQEEINTPEDAIHKGVDDGLNHNSDAVEIEPAWTAINKTILPLEAHVWEKSDTKVEDKSTWGFPHHHISEKSMVLHKGGFINAWSIMKSTAPRSVKNHLNSHRKSLKLTVKQLDTLAYMLKAEIDTETLLKSMDTFIEYNKSHTEKSVVGNLMLAWSAARENDSKKHLIGHIGEQRKKMGLSVGQMDILSKKYLEGMLNSVELEEIIEDFQKVNEFIHNGEAGEKRNLAELIKVLDEISESDSINDQLYDLFYSFRQAVHKIMFDDDMTPAIKKEKIIMVGTEFGDRVELLSVRLAELTQQVEEQLSS